MAVSDIASVLWESVKKQCKEHWRLSVGGVTGVVCLVGLDRYKLYCNISSKIKHKQTQCAAAFTDVQNQLNMAQMDTEECLRILNLSAMELQKELQEGKLKAVDVLHVYQDKALEVNKRLNCITEPLVDAEAFACSLDGKNGNKGLLHGIPISIKENFQIAGLECTAGFGQFVGNIETEDAVLVKVMKWQGAVPYVRTNIPQTMMTYECCNPVFGQTNNPYDVSRSPGGSTGGEAALIGGGASVIGFGTDIGGSIRAPSHFSGCYGLKTTLERLSRKGTFSLSTGQMQVSGTVGPMTRDLEGLVLVMRALLCDYHFKLDPAIPPIKFRDQIYESSRPMRVGFFVTNGYIDAVPACQRAVLLAKKALESRGHTVVEFVPPRVKYVVPHLYIGTVSGDGGRKYIARTSTDIEEPTVKKLLLASKLPRWLVWVLSWVLQKASKDPVLGEILRRRRGLTSVYEWWQQCISLQKYKEEFLAAWSDKNLDLVISPVFACTAIPHGDVVDVIMGGSYCMLYNVVNYPAGSLPVSKVTCSDVNNMTSYPKVTAMEKAIHKLTVGSEGLPVGVQVAGLPFQEELVLRGMKEIEAGLKS